MYLALLVRATGSFLVLSHPQVCFWFCLCEVECLFCCGLVFVVVLY